ncbi:carboxypeptidase N subunit 2-like [Aphidius gifuensis]|uniref:carboxypeptidase N subunit 2-like n=1 Tax=Aphidius gifuensis TaxID=684658 RepID=UPI001CDB516D|nr:carboxypeptidase N subunit 2-like [Aphidius gifuensis]
MVVKDLMVFLASSVVGTFMLFVACSLVIPSSTEKNSKIISTGAQSILHKLENDNDAVDSSNVIKSQIDMKTHTTVSSILDKYFSDLKGHLSVPRELELENYNNDDDDLETYLIHQQNRQKNINENDLVTKLSLGVIKLNANLNLQQEKISKIMEDLTKEKKNYKILFDAKTLLGNKLLTLLLGNEGSNYELSQFNDITCQQISCQDKEQTQTLSQFDRVFYNENLNSYDIDLGGRNLAFIPKDLFTGFTNLKGLCLRLDLDYNNLTALSSSLEKLETLDLSYNQLNSIQPGTFNNLLNLKHLSLQENHLTSLPKNIFTGLKNLESLNIGLNRLNYLESSTFVGLSKLRQLWIGYNNLTTLPKDIFYGLDNLEMLALHSNQLKYLESSTFNGLLKLEFLHMEENNLTTLPKNIFNDLGNEDLNSYEINLNSKNLAVLPKDIFTGFKNVRTLNLMYNRLYYLESSTFNLSNLQELNLMHNNLAELSSDIFNGLKKLEILYLSDNRINSLQPGIFNNLSNLQILSISQNNLTTLPKLVKCFSKI